MAREQKKAGSVFDFLYADHKRIALFLSQFSDHGNLINLVHSRGTQSEGAVEAGLAGIAKGSHTGSEHEGIEKHFDTQWSQVYNFLDEIQDRSLLNRNIEGAAIGEVVIAAGALTIASTKAFEKTFGALGSAPGAQAAGLNAIGLQIIGSIDQPVFMVLKTEAARLWATLVSDYLITSAADINLKHGLNVAGKWHVIGIKDCVPSPIQTPSIPHERICGDGDNSFSKAVSDLWENFRLILGRPSDCYGVTPLIIMREVGQSSI